MLQDKKILIGVSGSIAAYKSAFLVREFIKKGADVRVIITEAAKDFITPLTLSTLSKNPVESHFIKDNEKGVWANHVELGRWADLFIIAPATALQISRMAYGKAENLLTAVYLSSTCPVFVAPAMDHDMYLHFSTQKNIDELKKAGVNFLDSDEGELASGISGYGRMMEPENIISSIEVFLQNQERFKEKKVLVTAGPTYEKIDPVRFIGNYSSGKMGYAIAKKFAEQGANVELISGPVNLTMNHKNVNITYVESAWEMYQEAVSRFNDSDIAVLSAAVADYKVKTIQKDKIKKDNAVDDNLTLELEHTQDIAKKLGQIKKANQFLVGFALETIEETTNAFKKIESKNLDLVVLNSLNDEGAGFNYDTNRVKFIDKYNNIKEFELKKKDEVAQDLTSVIYEKLFF